MRRPFGVRLVRSYSRCSVSPAVNHGKDEAYVEPGLPLSAHEEARQVLALTEAFAKKRILEQKFVEMIGASRNDDVKSGRLIRSYPVRTDSRDDVSERYLFNSLPLANSHKTCGPNEPFVI